MTGQGEARQDKTALRLSYAAVRLREQRQRLRSSGSGVQALEADVRKGRGGVGDGAHDFEGGARFLVHVKLVVLHDARQDRLEFQQSHAAAHALARPEAERLADDRVVQELERRALALGLLLVAPA
eukprot:CAMPEP_0202069038 /NCGR_PEP_ID=MMETSP0964-20121228/216_1 /ASSEMBLY_ACC=CAM_ASM_000500 /TAXON_ID=4773 /ORGANISM="Schizochytrium aggregatum, Strain ATCC28209" /LENGTH=125 /DNA_ID=CAMNT_0048635775 /DNA_START=366 /DNA_END=739 /DNA_ORIENTATION=-